MSNTFTAEFQTVSPAPADTGAAVQSNLEKIWQRLFGRLDVTYAASLVFDLSDGRTRIVSTLSGNLSITTTGLAAGREVEIVLKADGSTRSLSLEAWIPQGGALPTTLAAGKTGTLTLKSDGNTAAEIRAFWHVQP
jgi:hypothetical protein